MALVVQDDRWYLFVSHLWHSGWSLVDVTDPGAPQLQRFMPGPANTWTLQVTASANLLATSLERIHPGWGGDPTLPHDEGIDLWDIEDVRTLVQVEDVLVDARGIVYFTEKNSGLYVAEWTAT